MNLIRIHNLRQTIARLIFSIGLFCIASSVKADQWGDWTYTTDGSNVTITGFTGSEFVETNYNIVVPDNISNMPVVAIADHGFQEYFGQTISISTGVMSIGSYAFGNSPNLKTVDIPTSTTHIGEGAFFLCANLLNIVIPPNVKSIEISTFMDCLGLTNVVIPATVTNIGSGTFYHCSNLSQIILPPNLTAIQEVTFMNCISLKEIIIPDGVTNIAGYAFMNCSQLENVVIPDSVAMIDEFAFYGGDSLTSIDIPASVSNIGDSAFARCSALTSMYFKGDAPNLGSSVFDGDTNLTVYYYSWTTGWTNTFGGSPTVPIDISFEVNNGAVTITGYTGTNSFLSIPNTISNLPVTAVGEWAFNNKTNLTGVSFPASLSNIGTGAFLNCFSLQSVTIPPNVTNVGTYAFIDCIGLTTLVLSNGITSLQDFAFFTCTNLTSITIPASLSHIGMAVFADNPSLLTFSVSPSNQFFSSSNDILFDKSLTTLIQCPSAKTSGLSIPASVVNVGDFSFGSCFSLTNMVIPNGVTNIGQYAFYNCPRLTNAIVPASVVNIGANAFSWATRLTNIVFKGNPPAIALPVFDWDNALTVYYYPWTSGWTGSFGGRPTQINPAYTQWLLNNNFSTNGIESTTNDYDHDGMLNWQEYLAGTNPTNDADKLAISFIGTGTNQSQVSWLAKSNVSYQVMKSSDLKATWMNASNGVGGNQQSFKTAPMDGLLQYADPNALGATNAFYRVNVVQ